MKQGTVIFAVKDNQGKIWPVYPDQTGNSIGLGKRVTFDSYIPSDNHESSTDETEYAVVERVLTKRDKFIDFNAPVIGGCIDMMEEKGYVENTSFIETILGFHKVVGEMEMVVSIYLDGAMEIDGYDVADADHTEAKFTTGIINPMPEQLKIMLDVFEFQQKA